MDTTRMIVRDETILIDFQLVFKAIREEQPFNHNTLLPCPIIDNSEKMWELIQKYSAKWCGDNTSTWAHLKASISQIINMGMSGIGYVGVDVGGFGGIRIFPKTKILFLPLYQS